MQTVLRDIEFTKNQIKFFKPLGNRHISEILNQKLVDLLDEREAITYLHTDNMICV